MIDMRNLSLAKNGEKTLSLGDRQTAFDMPLDQSGLLGDMAIAFQDMTFRIIQILLRKNHLLSDPPA